MSRLGVVPLFSLIVCGCTGDTESRVGLRAIGPSHKDFGRVKLREGELTHVFKIQNVSGRRLRIANVRQNCSCLGVEVAAQELEPGATTRVKMKLDDKFIMARKVAVAVLEADDVSMDPLYLKVSASTDRECRAIVHPAQWALPAAQAEQRVVQKVFRVRQVMTEGIGQIAETRVRSLDRQLSIERVGEWTSIGKVIDGHAREAEVSLTFHRDRAPLRGSKEFELEFDLTFDPPVRGRSATKTYATILVKQL